MTIAVIVLAGLVLLSTTMPGLRQGLGRIPLLILRSPGTATATAPAAIDVPTTAAPTRTVDAMLTQAPPTLTDTPVPTRTPVPTWTSRPTRTLPPGPTPSLPAATEVSTPTQESTATATWTATPSPTAAPTQTPTPAPATPTPSPTPHIYTVKSGDTLFDIAIRFDTTVDAIVKANGLKSTNLSVGQHLVIPVPTPTPAPAD